MANNGIDGVYDPTGLTGTGAAYLPSAPTDPTRAKAYAQNPFDINSTNPVEKARAQDYLKQVDQHMVDFAGAPQYPDYQSSRNPDGTLKTPYQASAGQVNAPSAVGFQNILPGVSQNINAIQPNQAPLKALEDRALSNGPSPWLQLQLEQQKQNENNSLGQASDTNAGNTAAAESNLAMRGGLQSGARERVEKSGAESGDAAMQNVRNTGIGERLGLQTTDEANKLGILQQLPGQELANSGQALGAQEYLGNLGTQEQQIGSSVGLQNNAQNLGAQEFNVGQSNATDKYNISNSLSDLLAQNASNVNNYNQQMAGFASEKTGNAIGSGGKK